MISGFLGNVPPLTKHEKRSLRRGNFQIPVAYCDKSAELRPARLYGAGQKSKIHSIIFALCKNASVSAEDIEKIDKLLADVDQSVSFADLQYPKKDFVSSVFEYADYAAKLKVCLTTTEKSSLAVKCMFKIIGIAALAGKDSKSRKKLIHSIVELGNTIEEIKNPKEDCPITTEIARHSTKISYGIIGSIGVGLIFVNPLSALVYFPAVYILSHPSNFVVRGLVIQITAKIIDKEHLTSTQEFEAFGDLAVELLQQTLKGILYDKVRDLEKDFRRFLRRKIQ
jgi:hypothetical protein